MPTKVIVVALDYVGVLGRRVLRPARRRSLLVNEIAPRVHNSGHWTEAVCLTDQFEQHIRAVLGWPLGDPARLADVVMENLIGDEVGAIPGESGRRHPATCLRQVRVRPGRKMGHLNRVRAKPAQNRRFLPCATCGQAHAFLYIPRPR